MVLELFIGLIAIAAASLLVKQGRRRRIWSVLILTALCAMTYFFVESLSYSPENGFIYQWLPYDALRADFNISSSLRMKQMFLPLIGLLAGLIYLNTLSVSEQHSLHFNTLMLLNFISLILLASCHDFLQLMFAGCMFSIISFYMPDLILAKKKIFIFNFLAEMAVFMALAIVYGKTHSVSLADLPEFVHNGRHKDLVAVLLLFAIGSKCGLFLLNGQYFNLKNVSFNRVVSILVLSVPLSGLVLLVKLRPLLDVSNIPQLILPWWIGISIVTGIGSALVNNNLKSKTIALSLAAYAFIMQFVYRDSGNLYTLVPHLLMLIFLASVIFILAFNAASEESDVVYLGGFWHLTKLNLFISLLLAMAAAAEFSAHRSGSGALIFAAVYMGVLAITMKMIYLGKIRADEKVTAFAQNAGILYWLPLLTASVWVFWHAKAWEINEFYYLSGGFLIAFIGMPVFVFMRLGNWKIWQIDILSQIYETIFVLPLKFFGRILWLAFDVVVIERSIIGSISSMTSVVVGSLQKVQEIRHVNCLLSFLLGLIIMLIYLGFYTYE